MQDHGMAVSGSAGREPRRAWLLAFCVLLCVAGASIPGLAAPPEDPGSSLRLAPDKTTLSWDASSGAEAYNVYRGRSAAAEDFACLDFRISTTESTDLETPERLFTYLVSSWNPDGESSLGTASDGSERGSLVPCADDDQDGVRDDQDNCVGLANGAQEDQDQNGLGDPCDPRTYDFEADSVGERPAGTVQYGGSNESFLVRDHEGDQGVSYDAGLAGVSDEFLRLRSSLRRQDLEVYLDLQDLSGAHLSLGMWADGSHAENAGAELLFEVQEDGDVACRLRRGVEYTAIGEHTLGNNTRLRLRLRKGAGTGSSLHVDSWAGSAWQEDAALFSIEDDTLLRGRRLDLSNQSNGRRPLLRLTGIAKPPEEGAVSLMKREETLDDWKLFQRTSEGVATIPLPVSWRAEEASILEARVVGSESGLPLLGFDFPDHRFQLAPAVEGAIADLELDAVPQGGNYDVEIRLLAEEGGALLGEDAAHEIAVGDVFLAVGQSNMAGYSGSLEGAEEPVDTVHLFGNDYRWKKGSEPMDDGTNQVDRVSEEFPAHSLMLSFAKTVSAELNVPLAIIPAPLGGTNLYSQWQRRADDPEHRGTLYGSSIHRVLLQGYESPIRGILWYQGESDVGRSTELYRADLEALVANYRLDLLNPSLFFANCQLATHLLAYDLDAWVAIQEAERQQAEADSASVLAALVDQPRADTIHLNVTGYKEAGRRLAALTLKSLYGRSVEVGPRLLSLSFAAGSRERIVLEYDKNMTGGQGNIFRVYSAGIPLGIASVSTDGPRVTLDLTSSANSSTTVSYGYSRNPEVSWLLATDGSGAALAFQDRPVL